MTLLAIALLFIVFLQILRYTSRRNRAELARQTSQRIAIQQWDPEPDPLDDDAPEDEPVDITTRSRPARTGLAAFYRTVHGPGLCSPKGADTTTS